MTTETPPLSGRAAELVRRLNLIPHPEGGHFREVFRSSEEVMPGDGRTSRSALTSIDFLLTRGDFSAWHRVSSDEVWHFLEGGALRLWLIPPTLDTVHAATLGTLDDRGSVPRHVVPAGWWQAAEPLGDYSYVGATVGPGFDLSDFAFLRAEAPASAQLAALRPDLRRLL